MQLPKPLLIRPFLLETHHSAWVLSILFLNMSWYPFLHPWHHWLGSNLCDHSLGQLFFQQISLAPGSMLYLFIFIEIKIVDLQFYVSFWYTVKWFTSIYFHILFHYSLLQDTIGPFCFFTCNSVYLFIPNSQFILPPSLFPFVTINLFSMSVSLFLFCE